MKGVVLTFNFGSSAEALKFIEVLSKKVGRGAILGEIKGNKVKVFVPFSENYRKTVREIKLIYFELHSGADYRPKRFEISTVLSASNLKVAIPVQALVDALRLEGYEARLEGNHLVTNAKFQHLAELAEKISERYEEAARQRLAAPLRRLVAVVATHMNTSISDAIDLLQKLGFIESKNSELVLRFRPEDIMNKLRDFY
ncbi:MAG: DUF2067 family protein [Thermofilum sp.]